MFGYQGLWCSFGWWWIFPIIMIVLCFFMMRGRMGSMICRPGSRGTGGHGGDEEKKSVMTRHE